MTDVPGAYWETPTERPEAPAAPPGATGVDWEDVGKGAAGGLGRGVAGTLGLPGTIGGLVHSGLSKIGVPEGAISGAARVASTALPPLKMFQGPDAGQVQSAIESYTGPLYQPKTTAGQYASTIGEFAPGMLIPGGAGGSLARNVGARVLNTVVPAVTSETAGQITKDTPAEPYARFIGGVGGGLAGAKLITPIGPASATHQAAVRTLERADVPLTAGQRTGSRPLQIIESNAAEMPLIGSNPAAGQAEAFDRAVTRNVFGDLPGGHALPDPRAVTGGRQALSEEYNRLTGANQLRSDPQLQRDLLNAQTNYERAVLPSQRTRDIEAVRNDIVDNLVAGQGQMPGDVYQSTRSTLGTQAKGAAAQQPQLATALRDTRAALDRAMERGLSPADAQAWRINNQRWANMRQTEGAVAAAGENLSPARVAQTVRARRPGQYAAQDSDLDRLAKAGQIALKSLPNSGTAARLGAQQLFNAIPNFGAGATGGVLGTMLGGPIGGAIGVAAPFAINRAITSRPGQAYLGNQLLPQNARDVVAQTLAQQAVTQPNDEERRKLRRIIITKD